MRFFSRKKTSTKTTQPQKAEVDVPAAILKTKEAISVLEKKQAHLEKRCLALTDEARTRIKNKDNEGAKLQLKRRKMLESEILQLSTSRLSLEQQINSLEGQQTQLLVVQALSSGYESQKEVAQSVSVSSIYNMMDDLQELQDRQQEVAQVIAQGSSMVDDDEVKAELARIEQEAMEQRLVEVNSGPTAEIASSPEGLPAAATSVPAKAPASPQQQRTSDVDDEQLKRLKAELAL